jgi:hypothetical protein
MSDVGLRDDRLKSQRFEFLLAERASEKTPRILPALQIDDEGASQLGLSENQQTPPSANLPEPCLSR